VAFILTTGANSANAVSTRHAHVEKTEPTVKSDIGRLTRCSKSSATRCSRAPKVYPCWARDRAAADRRFPRDEMGRLPHSVIRA